MRFTHGSKFDRDGLVGLCSWAVTSAGKFCLLTAAVLLGVLSAGFAERLIPHEADAKWGYKNARGQIVIRPQFVVAEEFSTEGIAAVVDEKGWAYIDAKGNTLVRPLVVDNGPDYFREGLARCRAGGKVGFFDKGGKIVIRPSFAFAAPFYEGLSAVCEGCYEVHEGEHTSIRGGRWGFIDKTGALVIPLRFDAADRFEGGRARVSLKGKPVYIDSKGQILGQAP